MRERSDRERDLDAVARAYREEWTSLLATLAGQLGGDVGLAEEAVAEAFAAATAEWPERGVPARPGGWLTTVARRRAIDALRKERTRTSRQAVLHHLEALVREGNQETGADARGHDRSAVGDDRLRLLFTCCHPALALESRVALTLRAVGGLEVAEIARAFLTTEPTMYQRLARAKRKIRAAGIAYRVPPDDELPERLGAVLHVVYLVYTEGHVATGGDTLVRADLCDEAIRLARLLTGVMPTSAEAHGLLALLLLTDARRAARTDASGKPVSLEDQDRSRWDRDRIAEGRAVLDHALEQRSPGPFQIQAAVAALHAEAPAWQATDWPQIAALYGELERLTNSPVATLNRAAAIAAADGPHVGLAMLAPLAGDPRLERYQPLHATRAELLARSGDLAAAAVAYRAAIDLSTNSVEQDALRERARRLGCTFESAGPSTSDDEPRQDGERSQGRCGVSDRTAATIRAATPDDIDAVASIWRDGWRDAHLGRVPDELARERLAGSWHDEVAGRVPCTWVAELDGAVVGFVTLVDDELEDIYVTAAARGSGVATALLRHGERVVADAGFPSSWLAVVAGNDRARAFYERHGWYDEGPFEHHARTASGPIAVPAHRYRRALGTHPSPNGG